MERLNENLITNDEERNDESNVLLNSQKELQGLGDAYLYAGYKICLGGARGHTFGSLGRRNVCLGLRYFS